MNPYAPPAADHPYAPVGGVSPTGNDWWFEGDKVVVRDGGSLPTDICIKTGEPTTGVPKNKKVQWAPPWVWVVFVLSWLIGLIIYLVIKKTGTFTYGESEALKSRKKTALIVGLGGSVAAFGLFFVGAAANSGALLALGGLGLFAAIIVGVILGQTFQVTKIRDGLITLKVDKRFRARLSQR